MNHLELLRSADDTALRALAVLAHEPTPMNRERTLKALNVVEAVQALQDLETLAAR